ncbi:MAG: hypothetical protein Q7U98_08265 [Methylicorpusculum sp.]|uniref:hypothetical protein n=1 Tax=Methylicorpusculum sp. TaxID=2713644 RepID=UPI00271D5895|nr:hypothetical protein [Methylicorpusculum sp.]MDO8846741.1 hypothetical protein [Methylicorpusculum sp.]MDO8939142.1 hypothetical protein [Methylicorpusculum sp.]MDP2179154.1 hypothetical protein [Methylicorpusculum sp.]MDP2201479.1 hypothetical protein [Methylicorpusculum sp.]MDP3531379.1 hypothetical protein [Methylicorpusculum sp.]
MSGLYEHKAHKQFRSFWPSVLLTAAVAGYSSVSLAGATFKIDDTKWLSLGAGLRTSFTSVESVADGKWSNDFFVDNMRLYVNAQIHEYIKLEINSECQTCNSGGELRLLDAIGKFEVHPMANLWVGRMLVPAERREMNGPFYSAVHSIYVTGDRISGTPFEPADFNVKIQNDGTSAGSFGRDDGATFWGSAWDGRIQYALGIFQGLRGGANKDDNLLYAQRLAFNFWEVEKNPGYYTSGTYYGKGGDILTLAVSNQYQEDGAGIEGDAGNFRGTSIDLLLEKVLGNGGVITLNGEYKNYGIKGFSMASRKAGGGFAMFEGNAYDMSGMYLFPQKIGIGQFQPFVRYVNVDPINSPDRDMYEAGVNYVIDGHNARIGLSWQYGDLTTKGLNYTDTATGDQVNTFLLGFQYQI